MTRSAPITAAILGVLLLFGVYMGAYYAVLGGVVEDDPFIQAPYPHYRWDRTPYVGPDGDVRRVFFLPANRIDRIIRPYYWEGNQRAANGEA